VRGVRVGWVGGVGVITPTLTLTLTLTLPLALTLCVCTRCWSCYTIFIRVPDSLLRYVLKIEKADKR
jgi:hypothetical protein